MLSVGFASVSQLPVASFFLLFLLDHRENADERKVIKASHSIPQHRKWERKLAARQKRLND
jgi:hypothetical protein